MVYERHLGESEQIIELDFYLNLPNTKNIALSASKPNSISSV